MANDKEANKSNTIALTGESLRFNLKEEIENLHGEEQWNRSGRAARTLVKFPSLRIVLTVLRKGAKIESHKAEGRTSIQALDGHIKLKLPEREMELLGGDLLALEQGVPHDVQALEDSAFLLTIAWSKTE